MRSLNRPSRHARREEGMVTAEAAVVIPSLVVVLVLMLTVLITLSAQLKAVDASREAARFAARGEATATAVRAGQRLAPPGAEVTIHHRPPDLVEAAVTARVRPFGLLPAITVRASSLAEREEP